MPLTDGRWTRRSVARRGLTTWVEPLTGARLKAASALTLSAARAIINRFVFLHARRYASAVLAVIVCLSVRLSQVGVLLKWLNLGSRKQRR